jgi:hypothetical protein
MSPLSPQVSAAVPPTPKAGARTGRPLTALCTAVLLALSGAGCPHQNRANKNPSAMGSDLKRFSVLTAKSKERQGFFDTYQKGDDLFIAVPKARLGEKFLLSARIAQGVGAGWLLTGTSVDGDAGGIVSFERYGDRLFLVQHQVRITAGKNSSSRVAVSQSYSPSIIQSAAIESERGDGAPVINARNWLFGDLSGISGLVAAMARQGRGGGPSSANLSRDRSYLDSVKAFPDNLNLRVRLTYPVPERASLPSVPDDRYLSVLVSYSFARLPAEPMTPRRDDDRVGYFTTSHYDLDSNGADPFVRFIHRWRLGPEKPLTYYLDPSIPTEYRRYVEAGVLAWNRAFAAAGWPQIIRVAPLPKGADGDDVRYPTIRWDASLDAPLGRGESLVDPRSGEIVGASILISSRLVRHYRRIDQPLLGERAPVALRGQDDEFAALWDTLLHPLRADRTLPTADVSRRELDGGAFSLHLDQQAVLLHSSLAAAGVLLPGEALPSHVLGQAIQFTAMHEVGHTLGLRHNFKASAAVPNERLADMAWVREHSLLASIMDYPGLNLPRDRPPADWAFYPPDLGGSDLLTIQYGYSRDDAQAQAIARQAAGRGHVLGTDDEAHGHDAVDPATQTWDLGADSLAWARERAERINGLLATLPTRILADNGSYGELTSVAMALLAQYGSAVDIALPYIGGQRIARDHVGDTGGKPPYRPIEKARQREAFDLLLRYAFTEGALTLPSTLLAQAGPLPLTGFAGRRTQQEVPLLRLARSFQQRMLQELLAKEALLRLRQTEQKHGADATLTLPELFDGLTAALWTELVAGAQPRNIGLARRDLQRTHIDCLAALLSRKEDSAPADPDSRALARYQLSELRRRLQEKEKSLSTLDGYTRAHLADIGARVGKLLDASVLESSL